MKRSNKEYGGGSGRSTFESDWFRVVRWNMTHGVRTTIECPLNNDSEIHFDGDVTANLNSDDKCIKEFSFEEIREMIECQKKESFEEGQKSKAEEIKKALFLDIN